MPDTLELALANTPMPRVRRIIYMNMVPDRCPKCGAFLSGISKYERWCVGDHSKPPCNYRYVNKAEPAAK